MSERDMTRQGVGVRVRRKEDARHLHGRGSFVSDMMLPGQSEVAFLRSPIAHGRIRRIVKPPGTEAQVFIRADLDGVAAIVAPTTLPDYKLSECHPLAHDKVRFVGEAVAMCVAPTRAEAEDLTEADRDRVRRASGAARCPCGTRRAERAHPRGVERQLVSHAQLRERVRGEGQGRAGGDPARGRAGAPGDGADGGQGRPRPLGRPLRSARRLCLDAGAAHHSGRPRAISRHRPGARARHLARRRRRLRLQVRLAARGALRRLARAQVPAAVSLCRRPPRASGGGRQLAAAPLPAHGACRRARPAHGARCRGHDRRRRLFGLAVHGRAGAGTSHRQPAGAVRFPRLPLPDPLRGDQQARLPAVSGRGANRRLLRDGADDRRDRARGRARAVGGAPRQSGPGLGDAVRQRRPQALRQRRLSQGAHPRARQDRLRGLARAAAPGRARRAPDRHRLCLLLRADRARHQRVLGLGLADHSGL